MWPFNKSNNRSTATATTPAKRSAVYTYAGTCKTIEAGRKLIEGFQKELLIVDPTIKVLHMQFSKREKTTSFYVTWTSNANVGS